MASSLPNNSLNSLDDIEMLRSVCDPSVLTPKSIKSRTRIVEPHPVEPTSSDGIPSALRWTESQIRPTVKATAAQKVIRVDYNEVPTDLDDESIIAFFDELYYKISSFVTYHYAYHDLEASSKMHNMWPLMSKEFVEYTSLVAEADPNNGGWNALLVNSTQRKWLVAGILMRVIQRYIFDEVLFGATDQALKLLESLDEAFLSGDGFLRQPLRSQLVLAILRQDPPTKAVKRNSPPNFSPVTENFYTDVAMLTDQINRLLLPLTDYLYHKEVPRELRQQLHNIVSDAAYISLIIRCHKDIILTAELHPGMRHDQDHETVEAQMYQDEKRHIVEIYEKKGRAAGAAKEAPTVIEWHRPLCKIAVWPSIRGYRRGSGEPDGENNGLRQLLISSGKAVWYFGLEDRSRPRESIRAFIDFCQDPAGRLSSSGKAAKAKASRTFWQRLSTGFPLSPTISAPGSKPIGVVKSKSKPKQRRAHGRGDIPATIGMQPKRPWLGYAIPVTVLATACALLPLLPATEYTAPNLQPEFEMLGQTMSNMDITADRVLSLGLLKGYM